MKIRETLITQRTENNVYLTVRTIGHDDQGQTKHEHPVDKVSIPNGPDTHDKEFDTVSTYFKA